MGFEQRVERIWGWLPRLRRQHCLVDAVHVSLEGATADLKPETAISQVISEGMVEAAEHHTSAGQGFDRRKPETFAHTPTSPIVCRVIEIHSRTIEQLHQVVNPTALHLHM
jgi:hypothetical protein